MTMQINPEQAAAETRKAYVKAEYGVEELLNNLAETSGFHRLKVSTPSAEWPEAKFHGSYYRSTDQMNERIIAVQKFIAPGYFTMFDKWNIEMDIDLIKTDHYILDGQVGYRGTGHTVSVKNMDAALKYGNVSLESHLSGNGRNTYESWALAGKSDMTAIVIGTRCLLMPTEIIHKMATDPRYRRTQYLTAAVAATNEGRAYDRPTNVLVPLSELLAMDGVEVHEMPKWYQVFWGKSQARKDEDLREADAKLWQ